MPSLVLLLTLSALDAGTLLPPVEVPAPPQDAPAEAPARRDPTAAVSRVEARAHLGEAKDTAQLLMAAPGLTVQESGGAGQSKHLTVRGAASSGVLVLLDGVPLNGGGGAVDLSRVPAAVLERLELSRGAAGARYGSGGLAGVLHLMTRAPVDGGVEASGAFTQGSFATSQLEATASGALAGGTALVVLHGSRSRGDFIYPFDPQPAVEGNPLEPRVRGNNQSLGGGALLKLRRALSPAVRADALLELSAEERGLAGTAENPTADAAQSSQRAVLQLRGVRALEAGELSGRAWGRLEGLTLEGGPFGPRQTQSLWSAGGEATGERTVGGAHRLFAAAQVGGEGLRAGASRPQWLQASVLAGDEWLLGPVAITPSLRLDRAGPFTALSPKLGAQVWLPLGLELTANAGRAFRAPSFLELYVAQGFLLSNAGLQPESAITADLAVAHRGPWSWLSVGGFAARYESLIAYEYYPPFLARPYNLAAAEVAGLEVEGEARPHPALALTGSYTWLSSRNLRPAPGVFGQALPYRPAHKLAAQLRWDPLESTCRHASLSIL